jgi:hypothetical protein
MTKGRLAGVWMLASSACVTAPYDGQIIPPTAISVTGYTDVPNAVMNIEMYNFVLGRYDEVLEVRSASSASFAAGYWLNSPPLYAYAAQLPGWGTKIQDGRTAYWESNHAIFRVFRDGSTRVLYGGSATSVGCMIGSSPQADFYTSAYNCGFTRTEVDVYADVVN